MSQSTIIKCPHCNNEIDVNSVLSHDIESKLTDQLTIQITKEFNQKIEIEQNRISDLQRIISKNNEKHTEEKELLAQEITSNIKQQYDNEKKVAIALATKENEQHLNDLMEQLNKQNQALKDYNNLTLENNKLKFEVQQQKQVLLNEFQEKLQQQVEEIKNGFTLALNQKDEQLKTLNSSLLEAQQKASQGSMQLQGEAQETAIESFLADNFKFDEIIEIKKGQRGADCLQIVKSQFNVDCGKIYYESKRTKEFSPSWIDKFKFDMTEKGADIGVLVTSAYPKGMEQMGFYNGVLICSFTEFKGVVAVLRDSLMRINQAFSSQDNKLGKAELLYSYITSSEFKLTIENLIGTFIIMKTDLESEKRSMNRIWVKRESQIDIAERNAIKMYGTFQANLGSLLPNIEVLSLENIIQ